MAGSELRPWVPQINITGLSCLLICFLQCNFWKLEWTNQLPRLPWNQKHSLGRWLKLKAKAPQAWANLLLFSSFLGMCPVIALGGRGSVTQKTNKEVEALTHFYGPLEHKPLSIKALLSYVSRGMLTCFKKLRQCGWGERPSLSEVCWSRKGSLSLWLNLYSPKGNQVSVHWRAFSGRRVPVHAAGRGFLPALPDLMRARHPFC